MTDEDADRFERAAAGLTKMVAGLRDDIARDIARAEAVRNELTELTKSGKLTRLMVILTTFVIVGMLTIGTVQFINQQTLTDVVTTQRDSALCPLYQIFLKSDTPANREIARKRGDDMSERDKAFGTIRQSYTALNCQAK